MRGEGIFLQFREESVAAWEREGSVRDREVQLRRALGNWCDERPWMAAPPSFPGARYAMIHSLSHALMRELGLVACQPRPWRPTTTQQGATGPIPDLVGRDFTATVPGAKMVGDITYIPTWEGWLYLATVIDCATRKVVGWAMGDHYRTPLITAAVEMAARNLDLPANAVFHSDRGSNYTSGDFAVTLERMGIRQSVGRTGSCFDNALAESFNAAVKVERVHRTVYPTRRKARDDVARYIEIRYNRHRLHSGLDYRTPQEVLDEYLNGQEVA